MTHYATLGVPENAGADDIKRAYRRLASQHHPDKGGDKAQFQEIQKAYNTLSDPGLKQQYDLERQGMGAGGFRFTVNGHDMNGMPGGMDDILKNFGFNFGGGDPFGHIRQPRRNKDLRIEISLDLASTLEDQSKTISVQTTNNTRETVEVHIPRGITNDTSIKYPGLGDNFFNTLPRGDLYVHFRLQPHPTFQLNGIDVFTSANIDCFTAITGGVVEVNGIDNTHYELQVPAGCQPNTVLRLKNQGIWQLNGSQRGHLLVKITVVIPENITEEQLALIKQLKNTL